ncbi:hypothetical protein BC835DRAFT_1307494 [Cytidiella melzeri]|nr:hypothetical protein BC835DRAFT_1307494 [Cytidiella melzeri]
MPAQKGHPEPLPRHTHWCHGGTSRTLSSPVPILTLPIATAARSTGCKLISRKGTQIEHKASRCDLSQVDPAERRRNDREVDNPYVHLHLIFLPPSLNTMWLPKATILSLDGDVVEIVPYSDFLLFSPEKIAPTLRKFQEDEDPERLVIVEAVLDVVQAEAEETDQGQWDSHWKTFMDTGLHKVCVDILLDDKTYKSSVKEDYPAWTFVLLRRFGVYLANKLSKCPNAVFLAQADEVLALLPKLWEYTWKQEIIKKHVPFRMFRYRNESEDLSISFIHTIDAMNNLYVVRHDQAPPVTNHIGHLALYMWTFSTDPRYDELMLRILILVIDTAEREELKPFFQEAVLDKNLPLPLAEKFCSELLDEYNINGSLRGVTSFLSAISVHCPPVLHAKIERSPQTLMQCIRIACQRQMCLGSSDMDTNSVLGASLSVIKDIMQDCMEPGSNRHLPAFFEMVDTAKIIPMVARITIHAIDRNDPSLFHCLQFILDMYAISGETCRRTNIEHVMAKVFKISRELWYPTVQDIRSHPIPVNNEQVVRMRDWALKTWVNFGKKLGFNERVEERRFKAMEEQGDVRAERQPMTPGSRRCHWNKCLCSWDDKPPHHMRMCKGCWRVWYCGANCQTRDWREGDHKEYCLRRRVQA